MSGDITKLWAIDADSSASLYSYKDTLATAGPALTTPVTDTSIGVNSVTGYALDVAFSWAKPSDKVTAYQLKIYDADGYLVKTFTVSTTRTPSAVVGKDTDNALSLMPGATYSWKVRVKSPLYSPYSSPSRTFSIEEAVAPVTEVTVEPAPAPEITIEPAPAPEVIVNVPPQPAPVVPSAIPAYLLWTIVAIGAILVIALIVLIVRTRRVV